MAIKKSELYSSLWSSCDELRGGMDASQYKDYVLVMLFIKYVSDKYAGEPLKTTVFIQCPAVFARNFRVCPFFEQIALFSGLFVPHSSRIGPLQAYLGL